MLGMSNGQIAVKVASLIFAKPAWRRRKTVVKEGEAQGRCREAGFRGSVERGSPEFCESRKRHWRLSRPTAIARSLSVPP